MAMSPDHCTEPHFECTMLNSVGYFGQAELAERVALALGVRKVAPPRKPFA
jgi:hypothetical protein